jgi:hypothetical protein
MMIINCKSIRNQQNWSCSRSMASDTSNLVPWHHTDQIRSSSYFSLAITTEKINSLEIFILGKTLLFFETHNFSLSNPKKEDVEKEKKNLIIGTIRKCFEYHCCLSSLNSQIVGGHYNIMGVRTFFDHLCRRNYFLKVILDLFLNFCFWFDLTSLLLVFFLL